MPYVLASLVPSCRTIMSLVGMLGFTCVYFTRFNLSVAIVCMVRDTALDVNGNNVSDVTNDGGVNVGYNVIDVPGETSCEARYRQVVDYGGTLEWDRQLRGWILSSFFYAYMITQIPGGWLSTYYGGKRVFAYGMLATGVATVLVPVAARTHYSLVIVLRLVMGLGTGVSFPAMHHLWSKWAPPLERTKLMAWTYAGTFIGNILAFFLSGWLCEVGFAGGWPSIFYVTGMFVFVFMVLWQFFVYDSPAKHPRISKQERSHIQQSIGASVHGKTTKVPWMSMMKSLPLWGCLTGHVCNNWGNYALSTGLPSYMKDVLKFDMKQNGFFSALPYLCMMCTAVIVSHLVDFIRAKGVATGTMRKAAHAVGCIVPAVLLTGVGFISCEQRAIAVALLVLSLSGNSFCRASYSVNHVDIAPRYAGILFGITNTVATLPGMIAPTVIGTVVSEGTREEYQTVFYICAGFYVFSFIVFSLLASGEEQPWAHRSDKEVIFKIPKGAIIINNSDSEGSEDEL